MFERIESFAFSHVRGCHPQAGTIDTLDDYYTANYPLSAVAADLAEPDPGSVTGLQTSID
jgi:hypothetical protein